MMATKQTRENPTDLTIGETTGGLTTTPFISVTVFKLTPDAELPTYATTGSSCFDLRANLRVGEPVSGFKSNNTPTKTNPIARTSDGVLTIDIDPGERFMIPTGLIFDLPENTTLKIYPRSGLALKQALILANCVGIVDADYVDPVFVILVNDSGNRIRIASGDRIAQGEVVVNPPKTVFSETKKPIKQKTNRAGGFGSTGK